MMKKIVFVLIATVTILLSGCTRRNELSKDIPEIAPTLTIDFSEVIGKIKPVNGINNGPKSHAVREGDGLKWALDATEYYKQCNVPFVRTHDTEYPNGGDAFIDIHCIFPDEKRDPEDPDAYHFAETDVYVNNILDAGADVYYRLGESIAVSAEEAAYQFPPRDYEKWAAVCAHIIAHYNQGWNDGFFYNIRYWQIWNEPDQKRQWNADIKEYYKLYRVTARYLKERFPDILIGASAESSATDDNLQELLDGIRADGKDTPLDFLGWHIYTDEPLKIASRADLVRTVLDRNGYRKTQSFLDEWNYVDDWENLHTTWEAIRDPSIAAFYGASMIVMQNTRLDGAMYYDGAFTDENVRWCGLYDDTGKILPGYYGFYTYGKLAELGDQVAISTDRDATEYGLYACAATGDSEQGVLIVNTGEGTVRFLVKTVNALSCAEVTLFRVEESDGIQKIEEMLPESHIVEMRRGDVLYIRFCNN